MSKKRPQKPARPCFDGCIVGAAMDGMCVGLIIMNPAGRIQWMNRSAAATLDLRPEECQGRRLAMVLRDPRLLEFWHRALGSEESVLGDVTLRIPRPAELKLNATRTNDEDGQLLWRVLIFCDVTAEKAIQLSLSRIATEKLIDMAGQVRSSPTEGLTPQEIRVLSLVGEGHGNEAIAAHLHVAVSTVRSHLKNVYRKMDFASRSEAVAFAVQNHLV